MVYGQIDRRRPRTAVLRAVKEGRSRGQFREAGFGEKTGRHASVMSEIPSVRLLNALAIVRTSVDHGTAFDIAGEGVADTASMIEATLLTARLAGRHWG